jgi:hypothetical protein
MVNLKSLASAWCQQQPQRPTALLWPGQWQLARIFHEGFEEQGEAG